MIPRFVSTRFFSFFRLALTCMLLMGIVSPAVAEIVQLRVTAENLAPTNSVSFAPLRIGFHNGTFDSFDSGSPAFLLGFPSIADAPIVTVAEGGSGSNWFPAFAAADPNATLGSIAPGGPFLPGASSSETFTIDTDVNPYFTFASMVVPSNDFFIGNDSPTAYQLFDGNGILQINTINQAARQIWDAGSELDIAENAAFLQIGNNDQRVDQNGTVEFSFEPLGTVFNGLTTAPGYVFDSQLLADTPVFRISFEVVPEPASLLLLGGVGLLGMIATGRRR